MNVELDSNQVELIFEAVQYRIENVEEAFTTETLTILKVNISWKEES